MQALVNRDLPATPRALRRLCATHCIYQRVLAARLGCTQGYVSAALHADRTGKAVSPAQFERIRTAALDIIYAREEAEP